MKYSKILFTLIFVSIFSSLVASNEDRYSNNRIDSLTRSWYQKDLESPVYLDSASSSESPSFNKDEVIARIGAIQSPFELTYNDYVGSYISKFMGWKDWMGNVMGRSRYYFPMIEEVLDANDLPLELKYLAVVESALKPVAVSRAGASGLWQFMYNTGKMYNLEINSFVDERLDPLKATNAAAHFLKDMYSIYGDWYLVIAAYNCGPGNVNKAIRRAGGGKRDYWEIYPYLPKETRGYVPAFIATAYLMTYYKEYDIPVILPETPLLTDTLEITQRMNLNQIADVLNVSMEELCYFNPQYRRALIPANENKSYCLRLPLEFIGPFIDQEDSILNYKRAELVDRRAVIAEAAVGKGYTAMDIAGKSKIYYRVKNGDSVGKIADWFDVRSSDLSFWNNIVRHRIKAGQKLLIYVPKSKKDYYSKFLDASYDQKQKLAGLETSSSTLATVFTGKSNGNYVYHKVKSGENPWTIAQQYPGVSSDDILKLNGITAKSLKAGQNLKIKLKN